MQTMRTDRAKPIDLLCRTRRRNTGKPRDHGLARRGIHGSPLSWIPTHASSTKRAWLLGESQTCAATDGTNGDEGSLPKEKTEPSWDNGAEISISTKRSGDRKAKPGMVNRHYVHPPVKGIFIPGGCDRLAQSVRSCLGIVQYTGRRVLFKGARESAAKRETRDFQQRPREPVYKRCIYLNVAQGRNLDQLGWERKGLRQHLYRAPMEEC